MRCKRSHKFTTWNNLNSEIIDVPWKWQSAKHFLFCSQLGLYVEQKDYFNVSEMNNM